MDDPSDITNFLFRGASFNARETTYQLDSSTFVLHICSNGFFPTSQALETERHNRDRNTTVNVLLAVSGVRLAPFRVFLA
jgi:hypothetical protein